MKKALLLCTVWIFSMSFAIYAQTTYVPDDIFEQVLIDHGYDDVLDDYVLTANIINVNILFVENYGIADLTGIEDFLALTNLYCQNNQLTELNVSQNTLLSELVCNNNNLIALDVSENPDLWLLDCSSNEIMTLDVSSSPNLGWLFVHNNQLTELDVSQNIALERLICRDNQLTILDVSQNTALVDLYCYNNQLTALNVTQNTALVELLCHNNPLTNLDVSQNTALRELRCNNNQLAVLDLSQLAELRYLSCYNNQLSTLNVSQSNALIQLDCANNLLTALDVPPSTVLQYLLCENNLISTLDVSENPALTFFHCYNNQLSALNVASGNNHSGSELVAYNNSDLFCIQIDEGYVPNNNEWFIDSQTQYASDCVSKTYIPDDIFEQALIDQGYDTVLDDYALTSIIDDIEILEIGYLGISDLTGLEDFTAMKNLTVRDNNLTTLDVSQMPELNFLRCMNNQLTSLDVSQNPVLEYLYCYSNQLSSLDVTQNPLLLRLYCRSNNLTSLNVRENTALDRLWCQNNNLEALDVSENPALTWLYCYNNNLSSLDVSNGNNVNIYQMYAENNPNLNCIQIDLGFDPTGSDWIIDSHAEYAFDCGTDLTYVPDDNFEQELINLGYDDVLDNSVLRGNISGVTELNLNGLNISDLTGIEDFAALSVLMCQNNLLAELDLSSNAALTILNCESNQLVGLNVANGSNMNFTSVSAVNNTNLYCIQIDENFVPDTNWLKDGQTQYSPDCSDVTYIPDNNFEQGLINLGYDTVLDDQVLTSIIKDVEVLYLNELGISDLTGIESFTALSVLSCNKNQLTSLDLSQNTALTGLQCASNQLTVLDVSQNTALTSLRCNSNQLSVLDVSQNPDLSRLFCQDNLLTALNISNGNNPNFSWVVIENNPFLYCAQIDNGFTPGSNWIKDYKAEWSVTCALGIPESSLDEIILYPNPTSGILHVKNLPQSATVALFDLSGRQLLTSKAVTQIEMGRFDTGLYFIKISDKGQSQTFKIIKN